jgi:hypothetical protein
VPHLFLTVRKNLIKWLFAATLLISIFSFGAESNACSPAGDRIVKNELFVPRTRYAKRSIPYYKSSVTQCRSNFIFPIAWKRTFQEYYFKTKLANNRKHFFHRTLHLISFHQKTIPQDSDEESAHSLQG